MMSRYTFTFLLIFLTGTVFAGGIEFFEGTWKEALAEAEKQEKIIFVDAYAVWCGPCKRMSKEVFTDDAVGEFYNKHFVNVKMDMERGEGLEFRKKYPVSAFPTLFYIDYTGEVVQRVRGARPVDGFIEVGRAALSKIDRSEQYAEAYEKGDRSPELVYNYIKALNQAGKPSLKIANDYLRDQENLSSKENLRIIYEGMTEADSKIFEWFIQYNPQLIALESEEAVKEKIHQACKATVEKGIKFEYRQLVDNAIDKMKVHYPGKAEAFELESEMEYAMAVNDAKTYSKACKDYAKKILKDQPEKLHELAQSLTMHFREDDYAMKQAEKIAEDAAKMGNTYGYYLTYASILALNGKESDAVKAAEKSLKLAKEEGGHAVQNVKRFIEKLNS